MAKHYKFGGSTATRTMKCPGWVRASLDLPKMRSTSYADEGNLLHDIMEDYYGADKPLEENEGRAFGSATFDAEVHLPLLKEARDQMDAAIDRLQIHEYECEPFVEYLKDFVGGSIDFIGKSKDGKTCLIADYKFGHNLVKVVDNASLQFYAMCAKVDPQVKDLMDGVGHIVYAIVQPKADISLSMWESNPDDLSKFEEEYRQAYTIANLENAPFKAGKHCMFCPVAPYCENKREVINSALLINPENADTLSNALKLIPQINEWVKAVESTAHELMDRGALIDGFKLVEKRATRRWADQKKAADSLEHLLLGQLYETKIKSPAAIEKILKKEEIEFDLSTLVTKKSSGTTVAPESDKREGIRKDPMPDTLTKLFEQNVQQ